MNALAEMIQACDYHGSTAAFMSLFEERRAQDRRWGVQDYSPEWWLAILTEEVGELAQAVLETHFHNGPAYAHLRGLPRIREEAVQCAAVAMAMIEALDRIQKRKKGEGK